MAAPLKGPKTKYLITMGYQGRLTATPQNQVKIRHARCLDGNCM